MDCEQLAALYEEYALGVLEGEERAELEAHLARAGDKCIAGVAQARGFVSQLALAAPDAEPPAALRSKIMSAIKQDADAARSAVPTEKPKPSESRAVFPAWAWLAAAALALITTYTIRQMNTQSDQLAELRKEMKVAMQQNQALQNQLDLNRALESVMLSPESVPLKLAPTTNKAMPTVHAYVHQRLGVAITADQMPPMPSGRTLQLWFVPKSGKPISAAIFHPDASGQIALVAPVNMPVDQIAALAITEEPAGGSPQPTTPIAWLAKAN
jgi:anti-sigma-K factor RskA